MKQVIVDENLLREIVDRLVKAIDPDRIVLFGSRARGGERGDSDIDLLVVKDSDDPPHRRLIPAYRALTGIGVPKDILWRTPSEIRDWAGVQNYIATRALREGRVLYEKRA
ncbi:MAG: nucleotidyltransferase domain-containing protein [Acidobacteriota bacterium]